MYRATAYTTAIYIEIARKLKKTQKVLFIDYIKAYDNLNRNKLLNMLAIQGCGDNFLRALGNSLMNIQKCDR